MHMYFWMALVQPKTGPSARHDLVAFRRLEVDEMTDSMTQALILQQNKGYLEDQTTGVRFVGGLCVVEGGDSQPFSLMCFSQKGTYGWNYTRE